MVPQPVTLVKTSICDLLTQANSLMLVPSIALMLVKSDLDPDLDLTCVDTIVSGSVPLFKGVADRIKEKLGRKDIRVKECKYIVV